MNDFSTITIGYIQYAKLFCNRKRNENQCNGCEKKTGFEILHDFIHFSQPTKCNLNNLFLHFLSCRFCGRSYRLATTAIIPKHTHSAHSEHSKFCWIVKKSCVYWILITIYMIAHSTHVDEMFFVTNEATLSLLLMMMMLDWNILMKLDIF